MAELTTVARPYAEAVYSLASQTNTLNQWSDVLDALAAMVQSPGVEEFVTNPKYTAQEVEALFADVLKDSATAEVKNFLLTLVQNGRLLLLPEVAQQFKLYKDEAQGILNVQVESAFTMTDAQKAEMTDMLSKKYGKTVHLDVQVNPDLIGGVRIFVGDDVIDASIRGKLQAMAASLKN